MINRFWVYDDEGILFRKFDTKHDAEAFLQEGWTIRIQPKQIKKRPTPETHGMALW